MINNHDKWHFVTGGAGFIGSFLVGQLLAAGCHVTVFDNLSSGFKDNLRKYFGHPELVLLQADLLDLEALRISIAGNATVWHLGSSSDVQKSSRDPVLDFENGLEATFNVLQAMKLNGINDLIYSSSSAVYGENPSIKLSEEAGPLLPLSAYGAAKLGSEGWISAYSQLYGIRSVIFRFSNVVGGKIRRGVIHDFILKLKKNRRELEILGDGRQSKPYILVDDCVEAMLLGWRQHPGLCDIYNLGCDSNTGVDQIARIVIEEMGLTNVALKYTGSDRGWPGDVPVVRYNTQKIRRLGWTERHTSDEAVRIAVKRMLKGDRSDP